MTAAGYFYTLNGRGKPFKIFSELMLSIPCANPV
jgi:hypothetical protein